jgi:hypothetical protein
MIRVAAVALAAALLAAGCGEAIDDVKVADTIQAYLEKSLDENVKSVDCPSDQPIDPKSTFDCEVVLVGGEEKIATVEVRNEDADYDVVKYEPKK